jgi:anti-anti-sigma regulatory factor
MFTQKLRWEIVRDGQQQVVLLRGPLNENSQLDELAAQLIGSAVFDLENVERINSCGVREWILFMEQVAQTGQHTLRRCSSCVVGQLNMIYNFIGKACAVESVMAPFLCSACGCEQLAEVRIARGAVQMPQPACGQCGQAMQFDEVEEKYFFFTKY